MNLQDRIEEILEIVEETRKDLLDGGVYEKFPPRDKVLIATNRIESAAKAILALVEEDKAEFTAWKNGKLWKYISEHYDKKNTVSSEVEPRCKTSPDCSHNTNGRDLDKPCSVEFPTVEPTAPVGADLKQQLLANFCDGDTWEDADASTFTIHGALAIAEYFYQIGGKNRECEIAEHLDSLTDTNDYSDPKWTDDTRNEAEGWNAAIRAVRVFINKQ